MKFCEKYEIDELKILVIITDYTTHITKIPILKLPLGTLHTSLIGHFCGHHFQSCSKQRNKQVMLYSSLPFPLSLKKTFSYHHHPLH